MPFTPSTHPGLIHRYTRRLIAFEYFPPSSSSSPSNPTSAISPNPPSLPVGSPPPHRNLLLWLGGLGDGLLTVTYPSTLAAALPTNWTLIQPLLRSSYQGWGTGSLEGDVEDLEKCVGYLRGVYGRCRVVVMGHSTGCQVGLRYCMSLARSAEGKGEGPHTQDEGDKENHIQALILQAPVSDREALLLLQGPTAYTGSIQLAQRFIHDGRPHDCLPTSATAGFFPTPVSATRWLSLASPPPDHTGADDLFSSDFSKERLRGTFGRLARLRPRVPVCVLYSGEDEFVPREVDKVALVGRWEEVVREAGGGWDGVNGGVVEGASHNMETDGEGVVAELVRRTVGFLERVERGGWGAGTRLCF
ncbi:DUF1749-domain-containing protein [Patellaria atrata CBS 101060]|uniref:DUF1749-domain-containing protein n=1 Tax=Patellaria atrata CBS 101060 TaxID=1346257 RepID=A0A9P4VP14_9PEZI|nr:DUF1749-domain-containing protein [Patellaria atrata CBS 101060]